MGMRVSSEPLSAFEAGYVQWLEERGYGPGAVADRLGQFRALSRWLRAQSLGVADLDPARLEQFSDTRVPLAANPMWQRRACGCRLST